MRVGEGPGFQVRAAEEHYSKIQPEGYRPMEQGQVPTGESSPRRGRRSWQEPPVDRYFTRSHTWENHRKPNLA